MDVGEQLKHFPAQPSLQNPFRENLQSRNLWKIILKQCLQVIPIQIFCQFMSIGVVQQAIPLQNNRSSGLGDYPS